MLLTLLIHQEIYSYIGKSIRFATCFLVVNIDRCQFAVVLIHQFIFVLVMFDNLSILPKFVLIVVTFGILLIHREFICTLVKFGNLLIHRESINTSGNLFLHRVYLYPVPIPCAIFIRLPDKNKYTFAGSSSFAGHSHLLAKACWVLLLISLLGAPSPATPTKMICWGIHVC